MEFHEMKEVWEAQNTRPLYSIDEEAIHKGVKVKINTLRRLVNISDWMLILIYLVTGTVLLRLNPSGSGAHLFIYLEIAWTFFTAFYLVAVHVRRIRSGRRFDRTVRGDLDQAISIAGYQVRVSRFISWNLVPLAGIMILGGWESGKSLQVGTVMIVALALACYVTGKGQQANKKRKRALLLLKDKLEAAA